jgi:bacteriorhodopsin
MSPSDLPIHSAIQASFTVTYILLLTTATITFIEAMRTPIPSVRHVMNLETAISLIAGYFYSVFVGMVQRQESVQESHFWKEVTTVRYLDWSITTPIMLITLCLVAGSATGTTIQFRVMAAILALNYLMLYTGYLGEQGTLSRITASALGFVPFVLMFGIVFHVFVRVKYVFTNYVFFGLYLFVWSMYGVVYLLEDEVWKNIAMNTLDCIAKCLVGIGLFFFYAKVIV